LKKKILIVGATGVIGSFLYKKLKNKYHIFPTSSGKKKNFLNLNLLNKTDNWPKIFKLDAIIFLGGMTKILDCEKNKILSKKINVNGLKKVIKFYKEKKTQIIFFSTTAVFKGNKKFYSIYDKKFPSNEYAKQKLLSEKIVLENKGLVIRVTKLVDSLITLIKKWKSNLKNNRKIRPFLNINLALVTKKNIFEIVNYSLKKEKNGIIHLSASEEINYIKIAEILCKKLKKNKKLIEPIKVPLKMTNIVQKHSTLKNNIVVKKITSIKNSEEIINSYLNRVL
tara:strand:+ start:1077 stop:1919 length:843 start_codon:yes stop_codon:yes gene_type:complete